MGKLSRTKGGAFERKIVKAISSAFPSSTVFRTLQADKAYNSDVTVEPSLNVPPWLSSIWWECNDEANPNPEKKLTQALKDTKLALARTSKKRYPVVVWHKKNAKFINVTARLREINFLFGTHAQLERGLDVPITMELSAFLHVLKERHGQEKDEWTQPGKRSAEKTV